MNSSRTIENLFPPHLQENKDYSVFIKVGSEELGLVSDYVELFSNLADADSTPSQFLSDLGEMVGYEYIDEADPDIQREVLKRIFNKHRSRGDEKSLSMMATHGDNDGYLGGSIFLPGSFEEKPEAVIVMPRDNLFTWSRSSYSGSEKRPDGNLYQEGIIEIVVSYITDKIKDRVETVKPAGLRVRFRVFVAIAGDDVVIKVPDPKEWYFMEIQILKKIPITWSNPSSGFSGSSSIMSRSGRITHSISYEVMIQKYSDARRRLMVNSPIDKFYNIHDWQIGSLIDLQVPILIFKYFRGLPKYSENFIHSGRYGRSGTIVNDFLKVIPYVRNPIMKNPYFKISKLSDLVLGDNRMIVQGSIYTPKVPEDFEVIKNKVGMRRVSTRNPFADRDFSSVNRQKTIKQLAQEGLIVSSVNRGAVPDVGIEVKIDRGSIKNPLIENKKDRTLSSISEELMESMDINIDDKE